MWADTHGRKRTGVNLIGFFLSVFLPHLPSGTAVIVVTYTTTSQLLNTEFISSEHSRFVLTLPLQCTLFSSSVHFKLQSKLTYGSEKLQDDVYEVVVF